ncbi:MAG: hypothetical protein IMY79_02985 [Chloroflexi bacterium]|nr:hypothetical protein [Chloroflexota bacterium]
MEEGMIYSRGGVPVWEDYRRNIIVDAENPILTWKAEKDKYSPSLFPPEVQQRFPQLIPRIGSLHSEDALSWNLFRSLHQAGKLHLVAGLLSPGMEVSMLYCWGHSVDESSERIDVTVQEALNEIEPWGRDGRRQQTETDVTLRGPSDLVMVECKLGMPGKPVKAWSRSSPGMRGDYLKFLDRFGVRLFNDSFDFESGGNRFYQLFRNYLLGAALSQRWGVRFWLLAVVNSRNTNLGGVSHETEFGRFCRKLINPENAAIITWQELREAIQKEPQLNQLQSYLARHPLI